MEGKIMTIEQCRERKCAHVSTLQRKRNCGVTDCSHYENYFEERWWEEEQHEFEDATEEEE